MGVPQSSLMDDSDDDDVDHNTDESCSGLYLQRSCGLLAPPPHERPVMCVACERCERRAWASPDDVMGPPRTGASPNEPSSSGALRPRDWRGGGPQLCVRVRRDGVWASWRAFLNVRLLLLFRHAESGWATARGRCGCRGNHTV